MKEYSSKYLRHIGNNFVTKKLAHLYLTEYNMSYRKQANLQFILRCNYVPEIHFKTKQKFERKGNGNFMKEKNLTKSEQKLLRLLWEEGPLSVMQLTEKMEQETGWSKQSVISFLKRMETKGFITYEQRGRTKYYMPLQSRAAVAQKERSTFLQNFYHGRLGLLVSAMAEENALSQEDIEDLRKVLDGLKADDGQPQN